MPLFNFCLTLYFSFAFILPSFIVRALSRNKKLKYFTFSVSWNTFYHNFIVDPFLLLFFHTFLPLQNVKNIFIYFKPISLIHEKGLPVLQLSSCTLLQLHFHLEDVCTTGNSIIEGYIGDKGVTQIIESSRCRQNMLFLCHLLWWNCTKLSVISQSCVKYSFV